MKPAIKKLWIKALRSGKYKKGIGSLKTKQGKYCCLGVLCDIYRKETGNGKWGTHPSGPMFKTGRITVSGILPTTVMRWAGLKENDPILKSHTASQHNDHFNKSYKQIANLIEKHL